MRRSRLLVAAVLASAVALALVAPAAYADDALAVVNLDTTAYPNVRMVVAVPAQEADEAAPVPTFTVYENGVVRPFDVEPLPTDQLEVALVIDTSGSMAGAPIAAAKAAAQTFLKALPATVPVSVIGFGATPALVSPRSTDRRAESVSIDGLVAKGQTALYDALKLALAQLPATGARPIIVLLTDGGDTNSATNLSATAGALAAAKVPLFAVELHTSETSSGALASLTGASGGRLVPAVDPNALGDAFNSVARQIVRQFAVTYQSAAHGATDINVTADGKGARATAHSHLDLPAAAAVDTPAPAVAPPASVPARSSTNRSWALVAGAALWAVAMLALFLGYFLTRTPKARGLDAAAGRDTGAPLARLADRAEAIGSRLLRQNGIASVGRLLELAGLNLRPGEVVVGVAAVTALATAVGWVLAPVIGLALLVAVPVGARAGLGMLAGRRRRKFSDQLAETLQILAGSLRAGHGLARAIDTVAREAESPTGEEFRRLTIENRLGRDFVGALESMADRVGGDDFRWVVQAIDIQREVGGDLAEILDNVASTVRDRTRVRRQVSALSAEGRMSAWVLMVLPFGLGGVMAITNRGYLSPLFETGTGLRLLGVAGVLLVAGGLWLRRIVKPIF
jgi:tight adherence protein B